MTTGPNEDPILSAQGLAMTSFEPPAANGTTNRIGRTGYVSALTPEETSVSVLKALAPNKTSRRDGNIIATLSGG
jgi:hypothetical protein